MLTAEKTHLLLTLPDGRSAAASHHGVALAAAALADLRSAGIVSFEEDVPAQRARLLVTAAGATGHPVLDALLPQADTLAGRRIAAVVGAGRPKAVKPVVAHLTETGELVRHKAFLATRHLPADGGARPALVAALTDAVRGETEPSEEDTLLIGVLHHLNVLRRVLPGAQGDRERREFSRRLESFGRDDVLVQAVRGRVSTSAATAAAATTPAG